MRKRRNTREVLIRLDANKHALVLEHLQRLSEDGKMNDWLCQVLSDSLPDDSNKVSVDILKSGILDGLNKEQIDRVTTDYQKLSPAPKMTSFNPKSPDARTAWVDPVSDPVYAEPMYEDVNK